MREYIGVALVAVALESGQAQPAILAQPESRIAVEGRPVTFSVQAQGTGTLRYQWYFNGSAMPKGTRPALSVYAVPSRAGTYTVAVTDGAGTSMSVPAELAVRKRPVITAQPRRQIVGEHQLAAFEVRVNNSGPYNVVQWWHHSPAEPYHPIPPGAAVGVNTFRLEIPDANNNDTFNGLYWIVITNDVGWAVSKRVPLTVVGPPQFTTGPLDKTVRRGGSASFSVVIAPDLAGAKTKQWYRDGQPIPGAVSKRLTIYNAQADATYHCVVTSIGGSTASSAARLTVY
jgi:hypothetical protein